jgi:hypothetical protein
MFEPTPNCVVENVGSGDRDDDLNLVLSDFVLRNQSTTKGAEVVRTSQFMNDANDAITETFAYSTSKIDTLSFKFNQGLKIGTKAEVKAGLSFLAIAKVEVSGEFTFTAEQSWSTSVTETFSDTVSITVPANSRVDATATLETESGSFDFAAKATPTSPALRALMFCRLKQGGGDSWSVPLTLVLPDEADRQVPVSGVLTGALALDVTVSTSKPEFAA